MQSRASIEAFASPTLRVHVAKFGASWAPLALRMENIFCEILGPGKFLVRGATWPLMGVDGKHC